MLCPGRTVPIKQVHQDKEKCKSRGELTWDLYKRENQCWGCHLPPFKWQCVTKAVDFSPRCSSGMLQGWKQGLSQSLEASKAQDHCCSPCSPRDGTSGSCKDLCAAGFLTGITGLWNPQGLLGSCLGKHRGAGLTGAQFNNWNKQLLA